jgi:surface antigen
MRTFARLAATILAAATLGGCGSSAPDVSSLVPDLASLNQPDLYAALTEEDVAYAVEAMQVALESGRNGAETAWSNRRTGHRGSFVPVNLVQTEDGVLCRDYRETIVIGEQSATYRNAACRDEDGAWEWVE